jgi:plastocyanin
VKASISRRAVGLAADGALSFMAGAMIAQQAWSALSDQVGIQNFAFGPKALTIAVGTRVTWVNHDGEPHTINSADPADPFKSAALDTGDKFSVVFAKPGTYKYFCSIHAFMVGTVVVK